MTDFRKFMTAWLCVIVLGTILTSGTLRILRTSEEIGQRHAPTEDSNHFSVQWMGFAPSDYSSEYPEYYICINNLNDDPLKMQIALQIKNQEYSAYYFKVEQFVAPPAGWSILPMAVGIIGVDETVQFVYDNVFRSRPASIPAGRLTESISLTVQAYYDPGYSNLYSQDDFMVTFNFLDYTSPEWTVMYNDDFDDGQTSDWTYKKEGFSAYADLTTSDTFYRSFQYSLRLHGYIVGSGSNYWVRACYQKSFDIGLASEVYLVYSLRSENWESHTLYGVKINGVTYFRCDVTPEANVWYQFAIKLKAAELNTVEIWTLHKTYSLEFYSYLDDVYVIAR